MNAAVSADDDDGARKIVALNLISAKDVDAVSTKRCETGIGFVGMDDGSDAHPAIVTIAISDFRFEISD